MSWDEIPARLEELNKTLKPGEKPWRVPTKEEFEEIGKKIGEIWDNNSLTNEQKEIKVKEKLQYFDLDDKKKYWVNSSFNEDVSLADCFYPLLGKVWFDQTHLKCSIQCIR
jgi:hypothetical protein